MSTDMDAETRQALLKLIGVIRRAYEPRPTAWSNKDPGEQKEISLQWVEQLGRYPVDVAQEALVMWMSSEDGMKWSPSVIDLVRLCQEIARERLEEHRRSLPAGHHCDGTGWVSTEGGAQPCERCNPYLRGVYGTANWGVYLRGGDLSRLAEGVERIGRNGPYGSTEPMPKRCVTATGYDVIVPYDEGVLIAHQHYLAERSRRGVTGPTVAWDAWMKGVR